MIVHSNMQPDLTNLQKMKECKAVEAKNWIKMVVSCIMSPVSCTIQRLFSEWDIFLYLPVVQVRARGPQKSIVCELSFPPLHSEAAIAAELRPLAEQLWQRLQQVGDLRQAGDVAAALGALRRACLLHMTIVGPLSPHGVAVADLAAGETSAMPEVVPCFPHIRAMWEVGLAQWQLWQRLQQGRNI